MPGVVGKTWLTASFGETRVLEERTQPRQAQLTYCASRLRTCVAEGTVDCTTVAAACRPVLILELTVPLERTAHLDELVPLTNGEGPPKDLSTRSRRSIGAQAVAFLNRAMVGTVR